MRPLQAEQQVIDAAEALARTLGDDPNHTVAAAVMDIDGRVHQGVNVYHFTGGPCAELVALGAAVAAGATHLLTVAAAGDRGRGLIPPCGRCRQVLLDQHPDILVAVPGADGPVMRPIHTLLPDSYVFHEAPTGRLLRLDRRYDDSVPAGEMTSTIRWNEPHQVGRTTVVFEGHPDFAHLSGTITAVEPTSLGELDPECAAVLQARYPTMPADADLFRVRFRIEPAG